MSCRLKHSQKHYILIPAGKSLSLPYEEELDIYVISGELQYDQQLIRQHSMVVFEISEINFIKAISAGHIILLGGQKFSRRYIEWNFVFSRQNRVEKARDGWKSGLFPKACGDEKEFIPLPKE